MSNQVKVSKQFLLDGHKEACQSWKERIEKEVPELFKSDEWVKGEWYSVSNGKTMFLFNGEVDEDGDPLGVGFDFHGKWVGEDGLGWLCDFGIEKSTKEEITSALIAEAKRRGFEKGVIVKTFIEMLGDYTLNGNYFSVERECYNGGDDFGLRFGGACIYANGKWASIIPAKEDKNDSLKASVKALEEQLKELKKQIG
jgi:hypothetical protein